MIEFIAEDEFTIARKGKVFTGRCPIDVHWNDLMTVFGKDPVNINRKPYSIVGVERHMVVRQNMKDYPIGLLARDLNADI